LGCFLGEFLFEHIVFPLFWLRMPSLLCRIVFLIFLLLPITPFRHFLPHDSYQIIYFTIQDFIS
jgi:hypothetical protein